MQANVGRLLCVCTHIHTYVYTSAYCYTTHMAYLVKFFWWKAHRFWHWSVSGFGYRISVCSYNLYILKTIPTFFKCTPVYFATVYLFFCCCTIYFLNRMENRGLYIKLRMLRQNINAFSNKSGGTTTLDIIISSIIS